MNNHTWQQAHALRTSSWAHSCTLQSDTNLHKLSILTLTGRENTTKMTHGDEALNNFQVEYERLSEGKKKLQSTLREIDVDIGKVKIMLEAGEQRRMEIVRENSIVDARVTVTTSLTIDPSLDYWHNL